MPATVEVTAGVYMELELSSWCRGVVWSPRCRPMNAFEWSPRLTIVPRTRFRLLRLAGFEIVLSQIDDASSRGHLVIIAAGQ
jgi:hypothetical protein